LNRFHFRLRLTNNQLSMMVRLLKSTSMVCLMPACKSYITIPIGWKKNEILAAYTAQASEDLQPNVGQFLIVFMQNLIDPASAILGSAMAGAAIACYKLLSVVICEFFSHSNLKNSI